jgi:CRP-like cAMP-binding protein
MQKNTDLYTTSNRLLGFLSNKNRALLASHMERVLMVAGEPLEEPNEPIKHVYFPEDGIASVVGNSHQMGSMEVGMIGKEGMTGLSVVLGDDRSPLKTFVQVSGSAMRIGTAELRSCMTKHLGIRDLFLSFAQVFFIQTAVANGAALLPQRLARWLVMCEDRLPSKHIPLTHEFLSIMLGVQRPGVTIALSELEHRGMIKGERGRISILDRPALMKLTNGTYGVAEAQYERLFGAKA